MTHLDDLLMDVQKCIDDCSHDVSSPVAHMLMQTRALLLLTEAIVQVGHEVDKAIRETADQ